MTTWIAKLAHHLIYNNKKSNLSTLTHYPQHCIEKQKIRCYSLTSKTSNINININKRQLIVMVYALTIVWLTSHFSSFLPGCYWIEVPIKSQTGVAPVFAICLFPTSATPNSLEIVFFQDKPQITKLLNVFNKSHLGWKQGSTVNHLPPFYVIKTK